MRNQNCPTERQWRVIALVRFPLLLTLFSFASVGSHRATAQENVGDQSTVMYPASYFAEYAPVTALDMLNRIPGMELSSNRFSSGGSSRSSRGAGGSFTNVSRGGRGLGAGSSGTQILINGKRTAGKNNNSQTQLMRIDADQVQHIEIIRGTSRELDVRGSTQVANVVLYEEQLTTTLNYEISGSHYRDNHMEPGGSLTYAGQTGNLDFLVQASAEPQYNHRVLSEDSILPDASPNDYVHEDRIREQTTYTFSTNLGYQINDKSSARFNALVAEDDDPTRIDRRTVDLRNGRVVPAWQREDIPGTSRNWEIGGDYEYRRDNGDRFKLLFISNENDTNNIRERWNVFDDGREEKDLFLNSANIIGERIVRGSYTMDLLDGQDIEFGAERAQTILDSDLSLGIASLPGTSSPAYGGLTPVEVPNANTQVEEIRYEPFAIHNWTLNSRMTIETSLVYEFSEIKQKGDFRQNREFSFFKPKIDYRFDITPQLQLRLLIEKFVRQMSFTDFVATNDAEDEDSNILSGNRNLRPDYWWNYNLLAEYRLPNDTGVVSANLYHHRHKDFLQRIDVSSEEGEVKSAAGNIGNGDMVVFEVKGSVRLNFLDLPDVLVTTTANVQDSWVTDPFLGITRRFNNFNRGRFDIGFRHDLPQRRINWGLEMRNRFEGNIKRWDIDDIEDDHSDPYFTGFLELIAFDDITLRFDVRNMTDIDMCRDRTRYVGHIAANVLEEIEYMCSGSGTTFSLKVSGAF